MEGGVSGAPQNAGCAADVPQRRETSHAGHQLQQVGMQNHFGVTVYSAWG